MKASFTRKAMAFAALTTFAVGLAVAQTPAPQPATAQPPASDSLPVPPPPAITGTAWVLMDAASGNILAGENYDQRLEPASITKVMTSYVIAAEMAGGKVKGDDQVMMTENAWRAGGAGTDGSYSGFEVNKTAPLLEMEKGMVVQSGNDAAIALAEHVAGSTDAFASLMNQYAARIGMKNSHFVNPHGLSAEGHYSTAHDLALLGRALSRDYPVAYSYNKIKEFTVGPITQPNRNLLLWRDPSVDGIKTGHHSGAGYCLMASAKRADQRLISVVMGSSSEKQRADDSQALLNWGFRFFETHKLYDVGKVIAQQKVWKGAVDQVQLGVAQPMLVTVPRGKYNQLKPMMDVPKQLIAPFAKGQKIGTVKVMLDGKVVAQSPLVAIGAVEQGGFFKRLWDEFWMWWESE
ncbi:D-alanyl-D-alanine carboxypeptidase (penicillin-binding protein 5/6) [Lysobacter niastensis]|uniref:serine-type D-Ala-D-Ala carboxypeptidase n=1 Tax=Lysobacter niastensis TaxID=380629 RepID=A0ABU1WD41_9GAMM|nr:D-alanyl-D-alanine carboxypeptidase family protein [Lysobacter niastensis]MDR7135439.1 D-alanyl-D-alanine carboxypeptidase (penicillin-binding protein 5/6) [Lysobacter niastensis]